MKRFTKVLATFTAIAVISAAGYVFAAELKAPAQIVSDLTGKTLEEVQDERADGKTYGTIANEADKMEEFQQEMLNQKKQILDERVEQGVLTQERAEEIYEAIKENSVNCDGTRMGIGRKYNANFGIGRMNNADNNGDRMGYGRMNKGNGRGNGMGFGRAF